MAYFLTDVRLTPLTSPTRRSPIFTPSVRLGSLPFFRVRLDLDSPPTTTLLLLFLLLLISLADYAVEERPSEMVLMQQLEEGGPDPLVFVLNANLLAMVKLVNCE